MLTYNDVLRLINSLPKELLDTQFCYDYFLYPKSFTIVHFPNETTQILAGDFFLGKIWTSWYYNAATTKIRVVEISEDKREIWTEEAKD